MTKSRNKCRPIDTVGWKRQFWSHRWHYIHAIDNKTNKKTKKLTTNDNKSTDIEIIHANRAHLPNWLMHEYDELGGWFSYQFVTYFFLFLLLLSVCVGHFLEVCIDFLNIYFINKPDCIKKEAQQTISIIILCTYLGRLSKLFSFLRHLNYGNWAPQKKNRCFTKLIY